MSGTALYLRLVRHVRPYWRVFALGLLGIVIVAATEPALPALLKPLLDGVFVNKDEAVIRWTPVFIIGLFVIRGCAEYLAQFALNWVGNRLVMDLRGIMFRKLLTLPARYYDDQASGNLISKLTFDVMQVTTAATSVLTAIFKDSLVIIGLLGWMLWLNWRLTLLTLVMAPVIVLVVRAISVRLRSTSREVQNQMGDMTQVIQETIEGHRVVKLFGGQDYEQRRFDAQADSVRRQLMKQVAASAASVPIVQFVAAAALATIVYLATRQSGADQITVGGFVSFITAMLMLTAPLKRITSVNEPLQRGLAAAESVFALVDQDSEPDAGKLDPGRARGEIRTLIGVFRPPGFERRDLAAILEGLTVQHEAMTDQPV
ncbi:MAG: ABC transporter transmembrane domain-containing protein, partial [Burkholderiales bacterium]